MASLTVYSSPGYQGYLSLNQDMEIRLSPISYQLWPGFEDEYYALVALWRRWLNTDFGWQKECHQRLTSCPAQGREQAALWKPQSALWTIGPPPPPSFRDIDFKGGETMKSLGRLWCQPRGSKPPASQWDGNDCDELPGLLCLRGFQNETAVAAVLTA